MAEFTLDQFVDQLSRGPAQARQQFLERWDGIVRDLAQARSNDGAQDRFISLMESTYNRGQAVGGRGYVSIDHNEIQGMTDDNAQAVLTQTVVERVASVGTGVGLIGGRFRGGSDASDLSGGDDQPFLPRPAAATRLRVDPDLAQGAPKGRRLGDPRTWFRGASVAPYGQFDADEQEQTVVRHAAVDTGRSGPGMLRRLFGGGRKQGDHQPLLRTMDQGGYDSGDDGTPLAQPDGGYNRPPAFPSFRDVQPGRVSVSGGSSPRSAAEGGGYSSGSPDVRVGAGPGGYPTGGTLMSADGGTGAAVTTKRFAFPKRRPAAPAPVADESHPLLDADHRAAHVVRDRDREDLLVEFSAARDAARPDERAVVQAWAAVCEHDENKALQAQSAEDTPQNRLAAADAGIKASHALLNVVGVMLRAGPPAEEISELQDVRRAATEKLEAARLSRVDALERVVAENKARVAAPFHELVGDRGLRPTAEVRAARQIEKALEKEPGLTAHDRKEVAYMVAVGLKPAQLSSDISVAAVAQRTKEEVHGYCTQLRGEKFDALTWAGDGVEEVVARDVRVMRVADNVSERLRAGLTGGLVKDRAEEGALLREALTSRDVAVDFTQGRWKRSEEALSEVIADRIQQGVESGKITTPRHYGQAIGEAAHVWHEGAMRLDGVGYGDSYSPAKMLRNQEAAYREALTQEVSEKLSGALPAVGRGRGEFVKRIVDEVVAIDKAGGTDLSAPDLPAIRAGRMAEYAAPATAGLKALEKMDRPHYLAMGAFAGVSPASGGVVLGADRVTPALVPDTERAVAEGYRHVLAHEVANEAFVRGVARSGRAKTGNKADNVAIVEAALVERRVDLAAMSKEARVALAHDIGQRFQDVKAVGSTVFSDSFGIQRRLEKKTKLGAAVHAAVDEAGLQAASSAPGVGVAPAQPGTRVIEGDGGASAVFGAIPNPPTKLGSATATATASSSPSATAGVEDDYRTRVGSMSPAQREQEIERLGKEKAKLAYERKYLKERPKAMDTVTKIGIAVAATILLSIFMGPIALGVGLLIGVGLHLNDKRLKNNHEKKALSLSERERANAAQLAVLVPSKGKAQSVAGPDASSPAVSPAVSPMASPMPSPAAASPAARPAARPPVMPPHTIPHDEIHGASSGLTGSGAAVGDGDVTGGHRGAAAASRAPTTKSTTLSV